jgi:hypothetical protein
MRALAAIVLAALHLAAASLSCPPAAEDERARAGHAAGAVHATHSHAASPAAASGADADELRAPCPCGCRHASGGTPAAGLGPALLRSAPALTVGAATSALALAEPLLAGVAPGSLDPVPRAA